VAYEVVTVPFGTGDPWGGLLLTELARLEGNGWLLCGMTTRTVVVPHTQAIGTPTRYEEQLVLVLHKTGEA
jgi:hypothetical protein